MARAQTCSWRDAGASFKELALPTAPRLHGVRHGQLDLRSARAMRSQCMYTRLMFDVEQETTSFPSSSHPSASNICHGGSGGILCAALRPDSTGYKSGRTHGLAWQGASRTGAASVLTCTRLEEVCMLSEITSSLVMPGRVSADTVWA